LLLDFGAQKTPRKLSFSNNEQGLKDFQGLLASLVIPERGKINHQKHLLRRFVFYFHGILQMNLPCPGNKK